MKKILKRVAACIMAATVMVTAVPAPEVEAKIIESSTKPSYYDNSYITENWLKHFSNDYYDTTEYNSTLGTFVLYYGQTYTTDVALKEIAADGVEFTARNIGEGSAYNGITFARGKIEKVTTKSFKATGLGRVTVAGMGSGKKETYGTPDSNGLVTVLATTFDDLIICERGFTVIDIPIATFDIKFYSGASAKVGEKFTFQQKTIGSKFGTTPAPTNVTYQWYKNGVAISGATKSSYTTPTLTISDNGAKYYCIAKNGSGSKKSNELTIGVSDVAPKVTAISPANGIVTRYVNKASTLSVTATGTNLKYQWYLGNTAISGATNNTYTVPDSSTPTTGSYTCRVYNSNGSDVTKAFTVTTENVAPSITTQPAGTTKNSGETATFSIKASGTNNKYQWYKATSSTATGTAITGATGTSYTTPTLKYADRGTYYYCIVTNDGTTPATSNRVELIVNNVPAKISTHPTDKNTTVGGTATFSVKASGTELTYQWYKASSSVAAGIAISGATGASYTTPVTKYEDNGTYYYCVVSCKGQSDATSDRAKLSVDNIVPVIGTQPKDQIATVSKNATFTIGVSKGTNYTYQWYKATSSAADGTAISGATKASYTTPTLALKDNGSLYYCVIENKKADGSSNRVVSNKAMLTVKDEVPKITGDVSDVDTIDGNSVTFTVKASGTNNTYQWYKASNTTETGIAIAGATSAANSSSIKLTNVKFNNSNEFNKEYYYCVVSNSEGKVTSKRALLTVNNRQPKFTTQPEDATVFHGETVTFKTVAGGSNNKYQWYYTTSDVSQGIAIEGATELEYALEADYEFNGRGYYCIASNTGTTPATSELAKLEVKNIPPEITNTLPNSTPVVGSTVNLGVTANGTNNEYQWYYATGETSTGEAIEGATNERLVLENIKLKDTGCYYCVVKNAGNDPVTSNRAIIQVKDTEITIDKQPENIRVKYGNTASFSVEATGSNISYSWYKMKGDIVGGGEEISGAINPVYEIKETSLEDNNAYYYCKVSNSEDSKTTVSAQLKLYNVVTLDPNGGECDVEFIEQIIGEKYDLPIPTNGNVEFDGWYTKDGIKITSASVKEDTNDITLYARWEKADQFISDNILYKITDEEKKTVKATYSYDTETFGKGQQANENITNVTIPKEVTFEDETYTVTEIADNCFDNCQYLSVITLPDSVTSIGDYAFNKCSKLAKVSIPDTVTTIGKGAFKDCVKLSTITLPKNMTSVEESMFEGCVSLKEITLPETVTAIGKNAFKNCSGLANVQIPESVTSIGEAAFDNCDSMTKVTVPEGVTTIEANTFNSCDNLDTVILPESVTSIGEAAFETCTNLSNIALPSQLTTLGDGAFRYCEKLASITLPASLTDVGSGVFEGARISNCYANVEDTEKLNDILQGSAISTVYLNNEDLSSEENVFDGFEVENVETFYVINYHMNDGTDKVITEKNIADQNITLKNVSRSGYVFKGWALEATDTKAKYEPNATECFGKNTDLYAIWETEKFAITFDGNGGEYEAMEKVLEPNTAYGELPNATREGYTFAGWFTQANGGTEVTSETVFELKRDQTLYAQWKANSYKVTFDVNGGVMEETELEVIFDANYGELPTATKDGYNLAGWYTDNKTLVTSDSIVKIAKDHVLYAKWTTGKVTVALDANGGTVTPNSADVVYKEAYGKLPEAEKDGYTFEGWYTSKTNGEKVTEETEVADPNAHTLYAQWKANTYKVTFDAEGGKAKSETMDVTYNEAYGELPTAKKDGYTFEGWYTSKTNGEKVTEETIFTNTENCTLYARWKAKTYTVTFNSNGGKVAFISKSVVYKEKYGELPTATKPGFVFEGWFTKESGGEKVTSKSVYEKTENQTLYAHWEKDKAAADTVATVLKLNKEKASVVLGKTLKLKVTTTPSNAATNLTWTSSNKKIATVNKNGKVTSKKAGTTTITVKDSVTGLTSQCKITVKVQNKSSVKVAEETPKKPKTATITFGQSKKTVTKKITLNKGQKMDIKISKYSLSAAKKKVTYKSSKNKNVKVTSKGKVTALKKGFATITVKGKNKAVVKLKITVK